MFQLVRFKMRIFLLFCLVIFFIHSSRYTDTLNKPVPFEAKNSELEQASPVNNIQINEKLEKTTLTSADTYDVLVSLGAEVKFSPGTAVDADGNLWTVYTYFNSSNNLYIIDILKSTNEGQNWTREVFIYSVSLLENPDIAIDLHDNNIYVVFEETEVGNPSSHDIALFSYNSWALFPVDNDTNNDRNPSIAIDNNGTDSHLIVAYEHIVNADDRKINVRKSTDGGVSWDVWHTRGYSDNFVHTHPDVIVDFFDTVYLVYAFGADNDSVQRIRVEYGFQNSSEALFENISNPFQSASALVDYPVISVSRSALFTTRVVVAFQWLWSEEDHDVLVASSVDGGNSWLLSMVGVTDYWEGRPSIISDGMDDSSNVLGNFYIVYGFATSDDVWFVISQAPYSNPTNWTTLEFYWGTKDILLTTNHVFGVTTYTNTNSTLVVTYAATQIYLANYTTRYNGTDAFITIISPNITTTWTALETEQIQWSTYGVVDDVDIVLIKGVSIVDWIAEDLINSGSCDWEVPSSTEPGNDYVVAIFDSNDSSISTFSFEFEITNPNITYPTIYFTNPTPVSAWRAGATYVITWNCKVDLGEATIELYKDDEKIDTLSSHVDGESHYKWKIPEETPTGDDYRLKIFLNDNSNIYGFSEEFRVIAPFNQEALTETSETQSLPISNINLSILLFSLITLILYKRKKHN
ncbi:MAG: Ser-Thr-rich GPI-anchored membrane family protein [Promethearchaeota archaeon]